MQNRFFTLIPVLLLAGTGLYAGTGMAESASGFLTSLPPQAPELSVPADGAENLPDTAAVVWHAQIHTVSFTLEISESAEFDPLFAGETVTDTSFTLNGLSAGATYHWRVSASNVAGYGEFSEARQFTTAAPTAVREEAAGIPRRYALLPVYPNPFNPSVTITYELPEASEVTLTVYNGMGQEVRRLAFGHHKSGQYTLKWDGRDSRGAAVTSGLYLCLLESGTRVLTQKMLLMR